MDISDHYEIITYKRGSKDKYTMHYIYYMNGKRHRDNDQPAVMCSNGTQEWYVNGQLHRDNDQPAYIEVDGIEEWWVNGHLVRCI